MKYLLLALFLTSCGGGAAPEPININDADYIIAGQSNASYCDWSYFTNKTGYTTSSIVGAGLSIQYLIDRYTPIINASSVKGIIFVHGESDAIELTDPNVYVTKVEQYRNMISSDIGKSTPLLISTVGFGGYDFISDYYPDQHFTIIRNAVKSVISDKWSIAYDDAQYFRDWGMLKDDGLHFTQQGCEAMMDAMIISVK